MANTEFQYKVVHVTLDEDVNNEAELRGRLPYEVVNDMLLAAQLNRLGEHGWQAVKITPLSRLTARPPHYSVILMRGKPETDVSFVVEGLE